MKTYLYLLLPLFSIHLHSMEPARDLTLEAAAINGNLEQVKTLLAAGIRPDVPNNQGYTPLGYAAAFGYLEIVNECLQACAEKKIIIADHCMNEALIGGAAIYGRVNILKALIEAGANPNAKIGTGITALHNAIYGRHESLVLELLKIKADVNSQTNIKTTPLMTAVHMGLPNICSLLISHGANPFLQDNDGKTALSYAAKNKEFLKQMICGSFHLPESKTSSQSRFMLFAYHAFSRIKLNSNERAQIKPIDRIKTILLCFKRLKVSHDVKNYILCKLPEDMVAILIPCIKQNMQIPSFAIGMMRDAIYQSTREKLMPELISINRSLDSNFDIAQFEANYGKELRDSINARFCEHQKKAEIKE